MDIISQEQANVNNLAQVSWALDRIFTTTTNPPSVPWHMTAEGKRALGIEENKEEEIQ
jgi:hypothetical protein